MQNLFNKKNLKPDPPKILIFQPQGASGWQHEPKRLPKGSLLGGPGEDPKTTKFEYSLVCLMVFAVRTCLGARMAPKSTPRAPKPRFLKHFWSILEYVCCLLVPFLVDVFHSCLHLLWAEGATENKMLMTGQGTVAGRPKASG